MHDPSFPDLDIPSGNLDIMLELSSPVKNHIYKYATDMKGFHLPNLKTCLKNIKHFLSPEEAETFESEIERCISDALLMGQWLKGIMSLEREEISAAEYVSLGEIYTRSVNTMFIDEHCVGMMTFHGNDNYQRYMDRIMDQILDAFDMLMDNVFTPLKKEIDWKSGIHGY